MIHCQSVTKVYAYKLGNSSSPSAISAAAVDGPVVDVDGPAAEVDGPGSASDVASVVPARAAVPVTVVAAVVMPDLATVAVVDPKESHMLT